MELLELLELLEHITDNVRNDRTVMDGLIYTESPVELPNLPTVPGAPYWLQLKGILWENHEQYSVKPQTHIVNGYEVLAPLTGMPEQGSEVFIKDALTKWWYVSDNIRVQDIRYHHYLKRGLLFETVEGAIQNAKAEVGIDPFNDVAED